jgi:putative ABC transport system permease protein
MYGLIQGASLSPLPYADPDRIVLVSPARTDGTPYDQRPTTAQWLPWRNGRTLDAVALYSWTFNFLVQDDGSESLSGMWVSRNFFQVLGLKPVVGRELTDAEAARPKVPPTAIIRPMRRPPASRLDWRSRIPTSKGSPRQPGPCRRS